MSDSLRPYGLQPAKLLCPWDFSSKNTGVDFHALLGNLPYLGIQLTSLMSPAVAGRFFTTSAACETHSCVDIAKTSRKNFLLSCATRVFPGNSVVKNLPAMQETWVWSLGWEDPLEGRKTHSSIPAWRIPWAEEPGGLQPMGSQWNHIT